MIWGDALNMYTLIIIVCMKIHTRLDGIANW